MVATDAPLNSAQLTRLARRAGLGLARTGSVAHHGSGEIFLAFSTSSRAARGRPDRRACPTIDLDALFSAAVDATEEAVLSALWNAERMEGREGRVVEALPHDDVLELLDRHGRLGADERLGAKPGRGPATPATPARGRPPGPRRGR